MFLRNMDFNNVFKLYLEDASQNNYLILKYYCENILQRLL